MIKETRSKYDAWLELCSANEGASFFSVGLGGTLAAYFAGVLTLMLVQGFTPLPALGSMFVWAWQVAFVYFFGFRVAKTVASRKALPVPWLWGIATVPLSFLSSGLVIGILAAMRSRVRKELPPIEMSRTSGPLVWNKLRVYNALFYYCAVSMLIIELFHRAGLRSSAGLIILLMLSFVGGCMKERRAQVKVHAFTFVLFAWVLQGVLTAPYGMLLANPLHRIFGPLREAAIWNFLASVPVLFFAMRESQYFTTVQIGQDDIVVGTGRWNDLKMLAIGGLLIPVALMLALSFAFVTDRRPFFNYPDPSVREATK